MVAGLLYASVTQISTPTAIEQPMSVTLVAPEPEPAVAPQPPVEPPKAEPVVEPPPVQPETPPEVQPEPEPIPEPPAPVQQPKPQPKPKPKPVHKPMVKPRPKEPVADPQPAPVASEPREAPVRPAVAPPAAAAAPNVNTGPKAVRRDNPPYPERARALGIEGTVRIQFDVNSDGQVENLRVISATPRNIFEREIRQVTRRWRYQSGNPGKNVNVTIQFKLTGVSSNAE